MNSYELSLTTPSRWRVYRFHHLGTNESCRKKHSSCYPDQGFGLLLIASAFASASFNALSILVSIFSFFSFFILLLLWLLLNDGTKCT